MTLAELEEDIQTRPVVEGEPVSYYEGEWDPTTELWEVLDLLNRCAPVITSILNRNKRTPFLPKKQKKEIEELQEEIDDYLDEWNFT